MAPSPFALAWRQLCLVSLQRAGLAYTGTKARTKQTRNDMGRVRLRKKCLRAPSAAELARAAKRYA